MSNFKPSIYQEAIFNFIVNGQGNAVINAVAGSGKSTTIIKALDLIPKEDSTIFLAFNKSIVEELKTRTPKHVDVKTLHSLGFTALAKFNKPFLDDRKVGNIIYALAPQWCVQDDIQIIEPDYLSKVTKLVGLAKANLCSKIEELEEIAEKHDIELTNGECKRAIEVLKLSFQDKKTIDYSDMIFMAATNDNVKLPKYKWVLVDECQDLNKAQQALVKKIMGPDSRFIAVGDPQQAIYGFAGSDTESFNNLCNIPNTKVLPLSVSYRCGKNIIKEAQNLVPQIEAFEGAKDGIVDYEASHLSIKDGDMVLCRNTAPIVKMCLEKIAKGQKAYVKGRDIGLTLINFAQNTKVVEIPAMFGRLEKEEEKLIKKLALKYKNLNEEEIKELSTYRLFADKLEVLKIISNEEQIKTVKQLVDRIKDIFSDDKDGICFSTIHKSKGLEADNVFVIDRELTYSKYSKKEWQQTQDVNLDYVCVTRAKKYLGFISDWTSMIKKKR